MKSDKNYFKITVKLLLVLLVVIPENWVLGGVTKNGTTLSSSRKPPVASKAAPPQGNKNTKFVQYKKVHKKVYSSAVEERQAQKIYEKTTQENEEHNKRRNSTYQRGENNDSDKSYEWKQKHRMGIKKPDTPSSTSVLPKMLKTRMDTEIPSEADWSGWCSPIKDQSDCGACWAFSALAVLEYLQNVILEDFVPLSEQELVDCNANNMDCDTGGWPTDAYHYVMDAGIGSANEYQYLAYKDECVAINFNPVIYMNETFEVFLNGDEEQLKNMVYTYGPIVAVFFALNSFTQYKSGIYDEPDCPTDDVNHAIVIVGYGTDENGEDYWLIRNSWGTKWGMNGYGKVRRGVNLCSIASYAMMPSSSMISKV